MSERDDHGKNFSGIDRIMLCAKSFISQLYDLLARHRPSQFVALANQIESFVSEFGLSQTTDSFTGKGEHMTVS